MEHQDQYRDSGTALLDKVGLTAASSAVALRDKRSTDWATAYAHFRFVTPEQVSAFAQRCASEVKRVGDDTYHKTLTLTALKDYPTIPPKEVLHALEAAQNLHLFDTFTIASITWCQVLPDPILFGQITGCPDYFVIAQWGRDASVEELLGEDDATPQS